MRLKLMVAAAVLVSALQAEAPTVPRRAPEFVLNFLGGQQKLLSGYRGKVVALLFVHTTCPHCQQDSKTFSKLYTEYGSRGFLPIDVAWNDMANILIADFVKNNGVNYPVAYATRDVVLEYLGISPIVRSVVPQILWIDRKGMIRSQTPALGDDQNMLTEKYWREMIETLASEPDKTAKKHTPAHSAAVRRPAN
jgi:peroxiredoxin